MCARLVGVIGYPLPSCPHHFWRDFTVFTRHRPPLSCENGFILSYALRLFRVLPSLPAPGSPLSESLNTRAACPRSSFLGVACPHRDISQQRRYSEVPPSPPSVLGVLHALDGLLRHRPCGFISPRCHVQGSTLQGFPLPAQPNRFVIDPCPLVGWLWLPTCGCPLAPASTAPPSGLCSVPRVRCAYASVTRRTARYPHGLSPPPGFPFPHRWKHLHASFRPWPFEDFVSPLR
jgi:hypothetical protein